MSSLDASRELQECTRLFYEAIARGDAGAVRHLISSSITGIGSEADEWWDDPERLARHVASQKKELGGQMRVLRASPRTGIQGDVGWVADREAAFGLSDASVIPFRFTGVFHRERGGWKLVQFHLSVAVPNEDAMRRPNSR